MEIRLVSDLINKFSEIEKKVNVGEPIPWPEGKDVVVTFSDGTKTSDEGGNSHIASITIEWDEDQAPLVNTDKAAIYNIDGVATCTYYLFDGKPETKTEKHDITLELEVLSTSSILVNGGFENGQEPWNIALLDNTAAGTAVVNGDDPHSGGSGMHFWSADTLHFTVSQEIADLKAGTYTFGGFLQGNGASAKDEQLLFVTVAVSKAVCGDCPFPDARRVDARHGICFFPVIECAYNKYCIRARCPKAEGIPVSGAVCAKVFIGAVVCSFME